MEVTYAGIALTGPTESEHAIGLALPRDILSQVTPLIKARGPYAAARGNRSSQVTFECVRHYGGLLEALEAMATFLPSLPETGTLEILFGAFTLGGDAWLSSCPAPEHKITQVRFGFAFGVKTLALS